MNYSAAELAYRASGKGTDAKHDADMRAVTDEQETANEELQSANEELLSGSEEMQSLTSELENFERGITKHQRRDHDRQ